MAEERQFTRAAIRVSVAQPAVSAKIRNLEAELGERLFYRDQRGITLTGAGQALLPHARTALAAAQRGRDTIASLRGLLRGQRRVGVSRPVDRRVAETLGEFHRHHQAIEILLREDHNEPLLDALSNGDLDAVVVGLSAQQLPAQIRTRVIAAEPLVVAVPPGHRLGRRKTLTLAQLRDEPVITLTHGSGLRAVLDRACRQAGFNPRIAAEAGELRSVVELTSQGLGLAVLPRSAVTTEELTLVEITRPRLQRRTALAWNESTTPAGRAFLALANEHFSAGG